MTPGVAFSIDSTLTAQAAQLISSTGNSLVIVSVLLLAMVGYRSKYKYPSIH
jgi:predicted tellurium resistance membrane protein TerC